MVIRWGIKQEKQMTHQHLAQWCSLSCNRVSKNGGLLVEASSSEDLKMYLLSIYFFVDKRTASLKKTNLIWKQCIVSYVWLALYQFPRRWSIEHELKVLIPTSFIWHLNPGRVGFGRCEAPFITLREETVHTCPKPSQLAPADQVMLTLAYCLGDTKSLFLLSHWLCAHSFIGSH